MEPALLSAGPTNTSTQPPNPVLLTVPNISRNGLTASVSAHMDTRDWPIRPAYRSAELSKSELTAFADVSLDIPRICMADAFLSTARQDPAGTQPSKTVFQDANLSRLTSTVLVSAEMDTQMTTLLVTVSLTAGTTKSESMGSANATQTI